MSYENILWGVDDGVATLTFNRPKALNALNSAALAEVDRALDEVRAAGARVLVVTGAGEKAFVAGADIAEMAEMTAEQALRFAERGQALLARLEALPVPVIAAVNGFALGGGCELALACDLVFASEKARFGQPEVNLGVIPGFGGTQRLVRRVGVGRARWLCLSGEMIGAQEAHRIGLCEEVVAPEALLERVKAVAQKLAKGAPIALGEVKRAVNVATDTALADGLALEARAFALLFGTLDQKEGMRAFLEKRTAAFAGR
jgi:enoyl-CoA hydratase